MSTTPIHTLVNDRKVVSDAWVDVNAEFPWILFTDNEARATSA